MDTWTLKKSAESFQIVFLDDDDHFLDTGFERLFNDQEDGRFGDPVPVDDGEEFFFGRFGSREETGAETCGRDNGFPHFLPGVDGQSQAGQFQVTFDNFDHGLLIVLAAGQELCGTIPLRANAFTSQDMGLEGWVSQQAMECWGRQFFGTGRYSITVEEILGFYHQSA